MLHCVDARCDRTGTPAVLEVTHRPMCSRKRAELLCTPHACDVRDMATRGVTTILGARQLNPR